MSKSGMLTIIAGGEAFVTPYLCRKISAGGGQCRILDFSTTLSAQSERLRVYENIIGSDAEIVFTDPANMGRNNKAMDGASGLIILADIFSDHDYEAFPAEGLRLNTLGVLEIMESACEASVKRVVHISSGVVYGPRKEQPVSESTQREAHDLQAAFKIASESIVGSYHRRGKIDAVILRLFNTYGPGQAAEAIIPYLVQGAFSGQPLLMGNTNHSRDFLYIEDMVDGILAAMQSKDAAGKSINLASGEETKVKDLINLVEQLTGSKIEVAFDPERIRIDRPDFPRWVADISLANDLLGFQPKWALRDGLEKTIESLKSKAGRWRD